MADWGDGVSASCTVGPIVHAAITSELLKAVTSVLGSEELSWSCGCTQLYALFSGRC